MRAHHFLCALLLCGAIIVRVIWLVGYIRQSNGSLQGHAVDAMLSGDIQLVFNTAKGAGAIRDSFSLRHTALTNKIPYYTTVSGSRAAGQAIRAIQQGNVGVRTLQGFLSDVS